MTILYVSFTTRPGTGSEGGVGWQFLQAHAIHALNSGHSLTALIDARDEQSVRNALRETPDMRHVNLVTVPLPRCLRSIWKDRRTRLSYLAWYLPARWRAQAIARQYDVTVVHQATFATASLPPVMPRKVPVRIWGPVAIPEDVVQSQRAARLAERTAIAALQLLARVLTKSSTLTLAQNDFTFAKLQGWNRQTALEPNIVVSSDEPIDESQCPSRPYFVMCGVLSDRKRPSIALEAFSIACLRDMDFIVAGAGPLAESLRLQFPEYSAERGRIRFVGKIPHSQAMGLLRNANALLHPAVREGAPWVVGEAASFGTPVVLLGESGASAVLRMSGGGGTVAADDRSEANQVRNFCEALKKYSGSVRECDPRVIQRRWSHTRLPNLIAGMVEIPASRVRTKE